MPYGYSSKDVWKISSAITEWMNSIPENWTESIVATDKNIFYWKKGDIIDVHPTSLKIYIDKSRSKTDARKLASKIHGHFYDCMVFKYQYFPIPEKPLQIILDDSIMTITSYDGALRIYKQLTGKKLEGFEDYGKDVYY